jgi:hypothetical protein
VKFTLLYRGELVSRGKAREKHAIRQHFHEQLKDLWTRPPLSSSTRLLDPATEVGELSLRRSFQGFEFTPLVAEHVGLVAELEVLLLWPAPPGSIITAGGDIDNRLKTLLDALKAPREPKDLPEVARPGPGETPFFCLLDDDKLVTRLNVETDRLLEPGIPNSLVVAIVRVETKQFRQELRVHPLTAGLV